MSKIKLAGVKRKIKYSPNHIGNDAMIFNLTAQHLEEMGYELKEYTETEFALSDIAEPVVFNMVRERASINKLQQLEKNGTIVINSGFGIENCTREKMTRLLLENNIPHPRSLIVGTTEDPSEALEAMDAPAFWIKRGDFHAIHREDVAYARSVEEVKDILKEFSLRGIPSAVINEHLVGDLVKFYGVANTDFCFQFYPFNFNHSKFGHEAINGTAKHLPFSREDLKKVCDKAGDVLNVRIYGGDCVVNEDGTFRIIDFNDWPSFAPCRDEAALKIAESIHKEINAKLK
ncbi:ATP-grasp domain-containing protein [Viscerimonas tarda]